MDNNIFRLEYSLVVAHFPTYYFLLM